MGGRVGVLALVIATALALVAAAQGQAALSNQYRPAVLAELRTQWRVSSLLAEGVEYFAKVGQLWPLVDDLCETPLVSTATDVEIYERLAGFAQARLKKPEASLLGLVLGERTNAPLVAAHTQIGKELRGSCSGGLFLVSEAGTACSTGELDRLLVQTGDIDENLVFDRLAVPFPNASPSSPIVRLFAEIGTQEFCQAHKLMVQHHEAGKLRYLLFNTVLDKEVAVDSDDLLVSGYGVELAVKSTEYKVIDEQAAADAGAHVEERPYVPEPGETSALPLPGRVEKLPEEALEAFEFKAATYIAESSDPLQAMAYVSQNLPSLAASIANLTFASDEIYNDIRKRVYYTHGAMMLINGMRIDASSIDEMNTHSLIEVLEAEARRIQFLVDTGMSISEANAYLVSSVSSRVAPEQPVVDVRSDFMMYLNDLETEPQYARMGSLRDVLQPAYPGSLRYIRKNLVTIVFALDVLDSAQAEHLLRMLQIINRHVPLRIALVLLDSDASVNRAAIDQGVPGSSVSLQLGNAVAHILRAHGMQPARRFLQSVLEQGLASQSVLTTDMLAEAYPGDWSAVEKALAPEYIALLSEMTGKGVHAGCYFVNGRYATLDSNWERITMGIYGRQIADIQARVSRRLIGNNDNVYDLQYTWAGKTFHGVSRLAFQPTVTFTPLPFAVLSSLPYISQASDKAHESVVLIVGRLTPRAVETAVTFATEISSTARVSFVDTDPRSPLMRLLWRIQKTSSAVVGDDVERLYGAISGEEKIDLSASEEVEFAAWLSSLYALVPEDAAADSISAIVNGRVFGPATSFEVIDLEMAETVELAWRSLDRSLMPPTLLSKLTRDALPLAAASLSSVVFGSPSRVDKTDHGYLASVYGASEEDAVFHITLVADPLAKSTQVSSGALLLLRDSTPSRVYLRILPLAANEIHNRYYRYVSRGSDLSRRAVARFGNLPSNLLLTLGLDVPQPWLVAQSEAARDMDNIRMVPSEGDAVARLRLNNLVVEGQCYDGFGNPPRGLQITLTPPLPARADQAMDDTIVMANLGYFQLQATPGVWGIRIRSGRSSSVYSMTSPDGWQPVFVTAYVTSAAQVRVQKRPGMEAEDVLAPPTDEAEEEAEETKEKAGIWGSIRGMVGGKGDKGRGKIRTASVSKDGSTTVHVFSVASGHLYERFLRLMMLSVMRSTESPVKFWFIKNFLSPQFTETLPLLSEHYGFEYELVTYKWPVWLRSQTEKQRTIWGYKILFLDVIFPLDLEKVIFVDADQIVRGDLAELMRMDLQGAPYGYVPFCDSRKETDGFRFWRGGWWSGHLQGKPYHISALYVIDLVRFRQLAAGDQLRQHYQALSSDPGSLANLDQDLPNHIQHYVPIFSLPQEWLWCETWCSDESLAVAKTIDLCNNPLTKEPKLQVAQRLLPEWAVYDQEIRQVLEEGANETEEHATRERNEL